MTISISLSYLVLNLFWWLYRLAADKLQPVKGLKKLCKWIEQRGLKRGAVTNAPSENAELIISKLGLSDFFQSVVLANDCARVKPFPDPYLKGLEGVNSSPSHTLVFEVHFSSKLVYNSKVVEPKA